MRHLNPENHQQLERTSVSEATTLARRYCSHCHLSTPKHNPRCIHCRRPATVSPQRDRESAINPKSLLAPASGD
jgi:hypothetical protein